MFPILPVIALGALGIALLSENRSRQAQQPIREGYGAVPPPPTSMASGSSVLRSAGLAAPGSWTQRNVLAAGSQGAYARRLAGTATEADFAVLGAARPGIASGLSGYISPAWTGSPWQPGPGTGPGPRGDLWSRIASESEGDLEDEDDEFGADPIQTAWQALPPPVQGSIQSFIAQLKAGVPGIRAYEVRAGEDINHQHYGVVTITSHDPYGLLGPISNAMMNAVAPYGVSTTMTPMAQTPGQLQFTFSIGAVPINVAQETTPQDQPGESPTSYGFFY